MAAMLAEKKVPSKVGMMVDWWVGESVEMWVDQMVVEMELQLVAELVK
jgi:hypothetical protein